MKKTALALGLCLGLASASYADMVTVNQLSNSSTIEQLNNDIQKILKPFQTQETAENLTFKTLEMDSERVTEFSLNALIHKVSPNNVFELKLDNLKYSYGDGTAPKTSIKGSLAFDFTKAFSQDELNSSMESMSRSIEELASNYLQQYGNAASVSSEITSTTKDENGNYHGLTALISIAIDLDKLEDQEYQRSMVYATKVVAYVSVNVKTGFTADAYVVNNPEYYGFNGDQEGLKELLTKFMDHDQEVVTEIKNMAFMFNMMIDEFMNSEPGLKALKTKLFGR